MLNMQLFQFPGNIKSFILTVGNNKFYYSGNTLYAIRKGGIIFPYYSPSICRGTVISRHATEAFSEDWRSEAQAMLSSDFYNLANALLAEGALQPFAILENKEKENDPF